MGDEAYEAYGSAAEYEMSIDKKFNNYKKNMAKTYIDGSSCKAVTGQFGEFFNMSFNIEKLTQYANEKGYVNITMSKRKEPGQYGDTHYFTLNDWKPESDSNSSPNEDEISVEDLPFNQS